MKKTLAVIALISSLLAQAALADGIVEGSAEAGKTKSITCSACHGADGNSVNPVWPSIAGQHATYIVEQLQAYKNGVRVNALMSGQAMMLSDEDMRDLAVYFSEQKPAVKTASDASLVDKGRQLYRGGDRETGASACMACHGPTGKGNPASAYPMIRGQYAAYTAQQLTDYANGTRKTDGSTRVMRDIAERLTREDIAAVSSYIQGLGGNVSASAAE